MTVAVLETQLTAPQDSLSEVPVATDGCHSLALVAALPLTPPLFVVIVLPRRVGALRNQVPPRLFDGSLVKELDGVDELRRGANGCRVLRGVASDRVDDLVHQTLKPSLLDGIDANAFVLDAAMQRRGRCPAGPGREIQNVGDTHVLEQIGPKIYRRVLRPKERIAPLLRSNHRGCARTHVGNVRNYT